MSFGSPLALLALLALPVLGVIALLAAKSKRGRQVAFTNLAVLEAVAALPTRSYRRYVPLALLALALATAAAATAHPRVKHSVLQQHATIVLLVDVSGSMKANDVEPTRLDAAVAAMRGFVHRLPSGLDVGLVEFSDLSVELAPPTEDRAQIDEALGSLRPRRGTAIGDAITNAIGVIQRSMTTAHIVRARGERLPAAIVLLSDGKQTSGRLQPLAGARQAKADGIAIDTVALGTPGGTVGSAFGGIPVPPVPELMRTIAQLTGGKTAAATNSAELSRFYRTVGDGFGQVTKMRDIASFFAVAAALLLLASVGLGRVWGSPLT